MFLSSGESETTFFRTFCMTNNLKCMLASGTLDPELEQFAELVEGTFIGRDVDMQDIPAPFSDHSEPVTEIDEKKVTLLSAPLYRAFLRCIRTDSTVHHSTQYCSTYDDSLTDGHIVLNANVQPLQYIKHRGKRFSTSAHCESDSHVIYRTQPDTNTLALGRLEPPQAIYTCA